MKETNYIPHATKPRRSWALSTALLLATLKKSLVALGITVEFTLFFLTFLYHFAALLSEYTLDTLFLTSEYLAIATILFLEITVFLSSQIVSISRLVWRFTWRLFLVVVVTWFVARYFLVYGSVKGPVWLFRELANYAMDWHIYFATARAEFLTEMKKINFGGGGTTSIFGEGGEGEGGWNWDQQQIFKITVLRVMEYFADLCLLIHALYLRCFVALCVGADMESRCRAWYLWDTLKYRFLGWRYAGVGLCWVTRTCPGMNWERWNSVMRAVYEVAFYRIWDSHS